MGLECKNWTIEDDKEWKRYSWGTIGWGVYRGAYDQTLWQKTGGHDN